MPRRVNGDRGCGILEMVRLGCTHDWGSDDRVLQHPSERDLRHGNATSLRYALDRIHDGSVTLAEEPLTNWVMIKALGVFPPRSSELSLCQRTPGNAANTPIGEQPKHLPLLVVILAVLVMVG
jgi:hypothetical protein